MGTWHCPPDCRCGRHRNGGSNPCPPGCQCGRHTGHTGMAHAGRREAMQARLERYRELRDEGITPADACLDIGLSFRSSGPRYERWYCALKD
jgi:hypothetical protein